MKTTPSSSSSEIANQVIWNNQFICIESKSVYNSRLIDLGTVKIGDLYYDYGEVSSRTRNHYIQLAHQLNIFYFSVSSMLFLKNGAKY